MAEHRHLPRIKWQGLGDRATLAITPLVAISTLRMSDSNLGNDDGSLFVLSIASLALRFGLRGGLVGTRGESVHVDTKREALQPSQRHNQPRHA